MGNRFFFLGIIELYSLRHAWPVTTHAGGEQQYIMVTCDILLTAPSFSNAKLSDFKFHLKFQHQRPNGKLAYHIVSSEPGKDHIWQTLFNEGDKKGCQWRATLGPESITRTGSDVIIPKSMLYLSASSFSVLLKSMRLFMSFYTSAYD